jgi:serine/threonine protein kinase
MNDEAVDGFQAIGDDYEIQRDSLNFERFARKFPACSADDLAAYLRKRFHHPVLWQLGYTEVERLPHEGPSEIGRYWDGAIKRNLVVKTVNQRVASPSTEGRLINEAVLMGQMLSPGIPPVYVVAENDCRPCYVMPDMGENSGFDARIRNFYALDGLRSVSPVKEVTHSPAKGTRPFVIAAVDRVRKVVVGRIVRAGGLPWRHNMYFRELLTQLVAACRTVAHAHSKSVVHRDLKPSNILISPFKEVFVADWGLAKRMVGASSADADGQPDRELAEMIPQPAGPLTRHGTILGTREYMSPEQARGEPTLDHRTDVFSLGACLYEVLTSRPPYDGRDIETNTQALFESPRLRRPAVPRALEAVCLKAMAKVPDDRYRSASDLADDIERWLADEPVTAYAEPWLVRQGRRIRRHRTLAAIAGIGLACVVATALFWRDRLIESATNARVEAVASAESARFDEAAARLERPIQELKGYRYLLPGLLSSIEAQQHLYAELNQFQAWSDEAWFYAGEERGDDALAACQAALTHVEVIEGPGGVKRLDASGLSNESSAAVMADLHRILLLKAAMHLEVGILASLDSQADVADQNATDARMALDRAAGLVTAGVFPLSTTAVLLREGARRLPALQNAGAGTTKSPPSPGTPVVLDRLDRLSAEDDVFLGILQVYLAKHPKDPFAERVKELGPTTFDFVHPRDTAVVMLRRAVRLEPGQYWSSFMLGRILASPDSHSTKADYAEALQAFNNCVALRKDYSRGYEQRALTQALLSTDPTQAHRRDSLRKDAVVDLAEAMKLRAPNDPSPDWVAGQTYTVLDRIADAVAAYTLALEKEQDLRGKVSRRNQLEDASALAERAKRELPPNNPAVKRLSDLIERAKKLINERGREGGPQVAR